MVQRWTFHDPVGTLSDYTFVINPQGDSPVYQKNVTYSATVNSGGQPVVFEGRDQVDVFSVTGTILTEAQYSTLLAYYNLRHQFLCTDDLGRQRYIYLTEFQPVRKMSRWYPWRHDYTLSGYFFSEVLPTPSDPNIPFS